MADHETDQGEVVPVLELGAPPNKGMKLTNLSEAPGGLEAPPRAFRRFAAVRTGSQLIPGVRRTRRSGCEGDVAKALQTDWR